MQPSSPYRPRVWRETRLLLTTGVLAVAALWLLARIRFQDLPPTPNPVPSVFSQLTNSAKFDDLAEDVAVLQAQLRPSLHVIGPPSYRTAAVWLREDLVVTWQPQNVSAGATTGDRIVARDPASGLAVVEIAGEDRTACRRRRDPATIAAAALLRVERGLTAGRLAATCVHEHPSTGRHAALDRPGLDRAAQQQPRGGVVHLHGRGRTGGW